MASQPQHLRELIERLATQHGAPAPPVAREPFALLLWEYAGYLTTPEKRAEAFGQLKQKYGMSPAVLAQAAPEALTAILRVGGIHAELRAERVIEAALIVQEEHQGKLARVLRSPIAKARKALREFAGIGEPGADKILLFCGVHASLALESNGLRTLARLGYVAEEPKNYTRMYRNAQLVGEAARLGDCAAYERAHLLLMRHGQEVCKNSRPLCGECSVRAKCEYYKRRPH